MQTMVTPLESVLKKLFIFLYFPRKGNCLWETKFNKCNYDNVGILLLEIVYRYYRKRLYN